MFCVQDHKMKPSKLAKRAVATLPALLRIYPLIYLTFELCCADPVVDVKHPPMGFMSWERFRCETNCTENPQHCIHENLYMSIADALVKHGFAQAGYTQVSIDDCWTSKTGGRDPDTHRLIADPDRFPSGIAHLAEYVHARNLTLGIYSDAGIKTCGGYPGSQHYEELDARTFAEWGVDYIKYDGCNIDSADKHNNHHNVSNDAFARTYTAFGTALKHVSRKIVYSCSWPAYLQVPENNKPYSKMFHQSGCNTWRNFADVQNTWESIYAIAMHWADEWQVLQSIPLGSYNDADMLLAGDDHHAYTLPPHQVQLQFSMWAMWASPLFIAGDVRNMSAVYRHILLNPHVIAISQDASRRQADCVVGCRVTSPLGQRQNNLNAAATIVQPMKTRVHSSDVQVWSKSLQGGESHVLAFLNLKSNANEESTNSTVSYLFPLQGSVAQCVDLWDGQRKDSQEPQDLCGQGRGNITENWNIRLVENKNMTVLHIRALNVKATSLRLLRVDYFCDSQFKTNSKTQWV